LEDEASNDYLSDGSTERRLTLAEVKPSNGFDGWPTDVGRHFRLIVFHAMPKVMTFWLRICHPVCFVSVTPSKARLNGFGCEWKIQYVAIERTYKASLRFTL
jgi:hypothetical protein